MLLWCLLNLSEKIIYKIWDEGFDKTGLGRTQKIYQPVLSSLQYKFLSVCFVSSWQISGTEVHKE